jgi:beta-carotene hydroxylase
MMHHGFTNAFLESKNIKVPLIAWPTVFLAVVPLMVEGYVMWQLYQGNINKYLACLINTVAIYIAFTPMHDATHGSVGQQEYRWLNNVIGHLSATAFPVPFEAFRHIHLQHHKYTNEENDPDLWTAQGPWFLLPLRWYSIELHYYYLYISNSASRPLWEGLLSVGTIVFFILFFNQMFLIGIGQVFLWGWILPGRTAGAILACFFDFLPHRPHSTTGKDNIYEATCVVSLVKDQSFWLTWPLLFQNYHNIHHLIPFVPFYYYSTIWHQIKDVLIERGTQIIPLFGKTGKEKVV